MSKTHDYSVNIKWTGNRGSGTSAYTAYDRNHEISSIDKANILASSDPSFRGDKTRYNPEELLVASLSSCHMLWYLHLCAEAGIIVISYSDDAKGTMIEDAGGDSRFSEVLLQPHIVITDLAQLDTANHLHEKAHELCYISNSCNFPVNCKPLFKIEKII